MPRQAVEIFHSAMRVKNRIVLTLRYIIEYLLEGISKVDHTCLYTRKNRTGVFSWCSEARDTAIHSADMSPGAVVSW